MLVEMTELIGRQVYTQEGRLLGEVANVVVDIEGSRSTACSSPIRIRC